MRIELHQSKESWLALESQDARNSALEKSKQSTLQTGRRDFVPELLQYLSSLCPQLLPELERVSGKGTTWTCDDCGARLTDSLNFMEDRGKDEPCKFNYVFSSGRESPRKYEASVRSGSCRDNNSTIKNSCGCKEEECADEEADHKSVDNQKEYPRVIWPGIERQDEKLMDFSGESCMTMRDANCGTCPGCSRPRRSLEDTKEYKEVRDTKTQVPEYPSGSSSKRENFVRSYSIAASFKSSLVSEKIDTKTGGSYVMMDTVSVSTQFSQIRVSKVLSSTQENPLCACKVSDKSFDGKSGLEGQVSSKSCCKRTLKSQKSEDTVRSRGLRLEDTKRNEETYKELVEEKLCPCGCGYFIDGVNETCLCGCENSVDFLLESLDEENYGECNCDTNEVAGCSQEASRIIEDGGVAEESFKGNERVLEDRANIGLTIEDTKESADACGACDPGSTVETKASREITVINRPEGSGCSKNERRDPVGQCVPDATDCTSTIEPTIGNCKVREGVEKKNIDGKRRKNCGRSNCPSQEGLDQFHLEVQARKLQESIQSCKKENEYLRGLIENNSCSTEKSKQFSRLPPIRTTRSGLVAAVELLQAKCKRKDGMIAALAEGLRGSTNIERIAENLRAPCLRHTNWDFDQCSLYNYLRGFLSTTDDASSTKGDKDKLKSQSCPKWNIDESIATPTNFKIDGEICRCLLLSWTRPKNIENISGYEIFIDGNMACRVRSATRTKAILECINVSTTIQISLYSVGKNNRFSNPTSIVYPDCMCDKN